MLLKKGDAGILKITLPTVYCNSRRSDQAHAMKKGDAGTLLCCWMRIHEQIMECESAFLHARLRQAACPLLPATETTKGRRMLSRNTILVKRSLYYFYFIHGSHTYTESPESL
jgi:hypothetical protein